MCYTITILGLLCCTCLPAPSLRNARDTVRWQHIGWESCFILTDGAHHPGLLAQRSQTTIPDRKEPAPEKQDAKPQAAEQNKEVSQQKDKTPAPKDFVPSEKIDADHAVDFPADI